MWKQRKPDTKQYILYDSFNKKCRRWQNKLMVTETVTAVMSNWLEQKRSKPSMRLEMSYTSFWMAIQGCKDF